MENQEKEFEVSLVTFWAVLRKSLVFVLAAALIVGICALGVSVITYTPAYMAKADVYIINEDYQNLGQQPSSDVNTYNLALNVVRDCKEILEGQETKLVIAERLGLSAEQMKDVKITVNENSAQKSRILNVSITSSDPTLSYESLCTMLVVAGERIDRFCSHDVKVVNSPELPTAPSNSRISSFVPLAAFLAAVLVYAAFLLQHIFDDRIRGSEDVEKLSMSLLAEIPDTEKRESGKKYGYYGKRYGGYYTAREDECGETENENG